MQRRGWLAVLVAALLIAAPLSYKAIRQGESIHSLCHAERSLIERQEGQTQRLLAHGYTFGIPKDQIPRLVQQSKESQERFLSDLSCH